MNGVEISRYLSMVRWLRSIKLEGNVNVGHVQ